MSNAPICPYCHKAAVKVGGNIVYPHRPDLFDRTMWFCRDCDAWVGCHRNTSIPLGRLANAELRVLKMAVHSCFDTLWQGGWMSRHDAYAWLSKVMNKPRRETHIGMFNEDECREAINHVRELTHARIAFHRSADG